MPSHTITAPFEVVLNLPNFAHHLEVFPILCLALEMEPLLVWSALEIVLASSVSHPVFLPLLGWRALTTDQACFLDFSSSHQHLPL